MKKIISCFISIAAGLSLAATPQVKNAKAFQQYPWGMVYISYEGGGECCIEYGNRRDTDNGKMCARERGGERLISGNICYQTHNDINRGEACGYFEYQILATPSEEQIQRYLVDWARYCSKKEVRFPFVEFIRQGVRIESLSVFYSDVRRILNKS